MEILEILKNRFDSNMHRHNDLDWELICEYLKDNEEILKVISNMEESSGEPDVFKYNGELFYADFSKESPKSRRSMCYDKEARVKKKKFPPDSSAEEFSKDLGSILMDEQMYRYIQSLEELDLKSSSWILTPESIRSLGGSLFCDRRYDTVFTYHNGADSYYASRGFRTYIKLTGSF